jgi:hypothetical protein
LKEHQRGKNVDTFYNLQNTSDEMGLVKIKFELESGLNNFELMLKEARKKQDVKEEILVSML